MIYLCGHPIIPTLFPDQTSQVWNVPMSFVSKEPYRIRWEFQSEAEFMHLAQLRAIYSQQAYLELPYLPYGRQDKEISNEKTFALRVFANLLNTLKFDRVICCDPHSDVAGKIINNFEDYYPERELAAAMAKTVSDLICYPDCGAVRKYENKFYYSSISAKKHRDQRSGEIVKMELLGNGIENKSVMIVDDICDGGATFCELAKLLYGAGASNVYLFVTHGIFSKGLKPLKEAAIKRIFTSMGEVHQRRGCSYMNYDICYSV
jgi:ribose-phosphate pyrophosphokinase